MRRTAALLLALLATGCVGTEPESEVLPACDDDCGECPATWDCAVTCFDCGECADGEAIPLCAPPPPPPEMVAFRFEGRTGTSACLITPAAAECARGVAPDWAPPEVQAHQPLALHANITSTDLLAAEHEYYASLWVDEGDGWTWDPEREPITTGPVPLALSWDLAAYPPGTKFLLWVEAYRMAGPAYLVADHAYAAEGALVHVPHA